MESPKTSPTVKTVYYRPARDELIDAIVTLLDELDLTDTPSSKKVADAIRKENPTWRLPERRVAKHLKRQLQARKTATTPVAENGDAHDDESVYSETSVSSRSVRNFTFSPLKYLSSFGKRTQTANSKEVPTQLEVKTEVVEDAPVDNSSNLLPAMGSEDMEEKTELMNSPKGEVIEETKADESSMAVPESDSKKEESQDIVNGTTTATTEVYKDDNDGTKNTCTCTIL